MFCNTKEYCLNTLYSILSTISCKLGIYVHTTWHNAYYRNMPNIILIDNPSIKVSSKVSKFHCSCTYIVFMTHSVNKMAIAVITRSQSQCFFVSQANVNLNNHLIIRIFSQQFCFCCCHILYPQKLYLYDSFYFSELSTFGKKSYFITETIKVLKELKMIQLFGCWDIT